MDKIKIVDARMGRGKTSAAIEYMQSNSSNKRFLYITPYLTEVERICDACDFEQPDSDHLTKLSELKKLMHQKKNVASTHSLFSLLDEDALDLIRSNHYSLIIDEGIDVVSNVNVTSKDRELILTQLSQVSKDGKVKWIDEDYSGKFSGYKEMADADSLYMLDSALIYVMKPEMLESFDSVTMMTYLFNGQYQKAYLDFYGIDYEVVGVNSGDVFTFSDKPDDPPPLNYKELIHIVDDERMNEVGNRDYSLSKNWYRTKGYNHPDIRTLRNNMHNFFRSPNITADKRLWTCFKSDSDKLVNKSNGRYRSSFLQMTARATNEYRSRTHVAYMINRFLDPNIVKFFGQRGAFLDADKFALSEMLQFIWRSAIRDNNHIELYIPSKRMRMLLTDWIEINSKGGC